MLPGINGIKAGNKNKCVGALTQMATKFTYAAVTTVARKHGKKIPFSLKIKENNKYIPQEIRPPIEANNKCLLLSPYSNENPKLPRKAVITVFNILISATK